MTGMSVNRRQNQNFNHENILNLDSLIWDSIKSKEGKIKPTEKINKIAKKRSSK